MLNSNTSSTCPDNTVNFGLLAAEIRWRVWGTPVNFNGFRVLVVLLHGTLVVGVSKFCGVEQGGHHVGYWPRFLVLKNLRPEPPPSVDRPKIILFQA